MSVSDFDKVKNVCKEMFEARKYILEDEQLMFMKALKPDGTYVHLYLVESEKLNVHIIKYYYSILRASSIKHGIIIYQNVITSSVKKILANNIHDIRIELFCVKELRFNITKHRLVPRHIHISTEGHTELASYPVMKKTDPISRFYGFKQGNLIKIIRPSNEVYYRVVR